MLHVGGGENIRHGAVGDFLAQHAGRAEFHLDLVAGFRFESLGDVGQGAAQAAGGEERYGFSGCHCWNQRQ